MDYVPVKIMKNFLKIVILTLILFIISIGVVTAADMSDFKAPSDFTKSSGDYFEYDDFVLSLAPYDKDISYDLLFEDDDGYSVNILGDKAEYRDTTVDHVGVLEIVNIDGEDYLVECYFDGDSNSKLEDCNSYINEFNELNDLEPISIN